MGKKKKRTLSKKQKAALAKGRRAAKAKRSGKSGKRKSSKKGKRAAKTSSSGAIRAKTGRRRKLRKISLMHVITPGVLTVELAAAAIAADVVTEVATKGDGVRFFDPVAAAFFAIALAHRSRDLVQGAYALEIRKLAQENFGKNAEGIPRESLEEMGASLLRKMLGMFHSTVTGGPAEVESGSDDNGAGAPELPAAQSTSSDDSYNQEEDDSEYAASSSDG